MTEHRVPVGGYVGNEKDVYQSSQPVVALPRENEMETSANVWEIDGREMQRQDNNEIAREVHSPGADRGSAAPRGQRHEHSELHF
jgi:hypothetical protein